MKVKESLQYNGKVLLQEREKQKISRIDIALKLTLNELQIKSIEENLATGFANNHFKELSIKRYANILVVPIEKVIHVSNNANNETSILDDVTNVDLKKGVFEQYVFGNGITAIAIFNELLQSEIFLMENPINPFLWETDKPSP